MKIISNYKDYYDHLTGIYGVDPLVVYDRRSHFYDSSLEKKNVSSVTVFQPRTLDENFTENSIETVVLFIAGKEYMLLSRNGKLYVTLEEMLNLKSMVENNVSSRSYTENHSKIVQALKVTHDYEIRSGWRSSKYWHSLQRHFRGEDVRLRANEQTRCPSLLCTNDGYLSNPKLSSFRMGSLVSAHDMYMIITEFLSKKDPNVPSSPVDMNRYESKGFDKKTSFRNM